MPLGPENEEDTYTDIVPVRSASGIWHLARFHTYRHLGATAKDENLREAMQEAAAKCWAGFVTSMASSLEHQEDMALSGQPDDVCFDTSEGAAMMSWKQRARDEHTDVWGFFKVRPTDESAAPEISVGTPFRSVVLANLPAQTKLLSIHDPRHTAAAAVVEVIEMIHKDMSRALLRYEDDQAWRALRSHASFLGVAARTALEHLPVDSFRDWERPSLEMCAFESIAERVATIGLTTRAQQGLALHFVTRSYADTQDQADDYEEDPAERAARVLARVATMQAHAQKLLQAMNEGVVSASRGDLGSDPHSMMFIFRPVPASVPVLALIPEK